MPIEHTLTAELTAVLGRANCALSGRGTTALWLALRALRRRDGPGEVILPDFLCGTALEGVLLAGFTPVFADVLPGRYTLSPAGVARLVTPRTRAILVVHLYGHVADVAAIRQAAPGIPVIEDAVQGIGGRDAAGRPVGTLGDLSFISFDRHKMIGGRGGALLWDDPALSAGIAADLGRLPALPELPLETLDTLLPPAPAATYAEQLRTAIAPTLLRPFNASAANLARILADWRTLDARITERNARGRWLHARLAALATPLLLPDLHPGDALWCYTVAAPSAAVARRIMRALHAAGISASDLYPALSRWFDRPGDALGLTGRLVNLWVDPATDYAHLERAADAIAALPWSRIAPGAATASADPS